MCCYNVLLHILTYQKLTFPKPGGYKYAKPLTHHTELWKIHESERQKYVKTSVLLSLGINGEVYLDDILIIWAQHVGEILVFTKWLSVWVLPPREDSSHLPFSTGVFLECCR